MGSIECIGVRKTPYTTDNEQKLLKEFRGLREDFDKLPKDDDMASGSNILFVDTGEYAEYFAYNKTWYII